MTYDATRGNIVLFGGYGEDRVYRTDTWTWDGRAWTRAAVDGPAGRAGARMAYDERADVVVMYGGSNPGGRLGDMWQWDGQRWTEVTQGSVTPGPRNGHAMAYDAHRHRLVLYGGYSGGPATADTWEWDGSSWRQIR
jgi:hypothetical protein